MPPESRRSPGAPAARHVDRLRAIHQPSAIRERLARAKDHSYLGDAVLGAIDGTVTTFAVVAGAVGGGFSATVAIVLGFANLLADGFSMAVSNYQGTKSERQLVEKARHSEERHIELIPEGEREEVRQIFAAKGFAGEDLERVVEVITRDRELWVDTMLTEELGLQLEGPDPFRAALVTFGAFVASGAIPLLPFIVGGLTPSHTFLASALVTGAAFFGVGTIRGYVTRRAALRSGIETLLAGGAAAALAYVVAALLRRAYDVI